MKQLLTFISLLVSISAYSQKNFFKPYADSGALVQDANKITTGFATKVNAIKPVFSSQPLVILNTQPFLIFYSPKTNKVNLPIWHQVIPEQKGFFYQLAGNEKNGKKMFGLFFNGFFLPHELGHALQKFANKRDSSLYQNEYFANTIAILYWRKVNRGKELGQCYQYAKQMVAQLPNPVPTGEDPVKYFNEHYQELGADPYKYGYYQFAQIIKIYEDKTLPDFDEYVKGFLEK